MTLSIRELLSGLKDLGIPQGAPVLAHISLSGLGDLHSGPQPVLSVLTRLYTTLIMPAFTFKCGVLENNHSGRKQPVQFHPALSTDRNLGLAAEAFRQLSGVTRSEHPLFSFSGFHADSFLNAQSVEQPWGTIKQLCDRGGWVLLLGSDQRANISIHYAAKLAGLPLAEYLANTAEGELRCPALPACPQGFNAADSYQRELSKELFVGKSKVKAYPIHRMVLTIKEVLQAEPGALLCNRAGCRQCEKIRETFNGNGDKNGKAE